MKYFIWYHLLRSMIVLGEWYNFCFAFVSIETCKSWRHIFGNIKSDGIFPYSGFDSFNLNSNASFWRQPNLISVTKAHSIQDAATCFLDHFYLYLYLFMFWIVPMANKIHWNKLARLQSCASSKLSSNQLIKWVKYRDASASRNNQMNELKIILFECKCKWSGRQLAAPKRRLLSAKWGLAWKRDKIWKRSIWKISRYAQISVPERK